MIYPEVSHARTAIIADPKIKLFGVGASDARGDGVWLIADCREVAC
jgi:hypothetical protein